MTRVVIDTNVLVSTLLFGGAPGRLVTLWKKRKLRPSCSQEIIQEYLRVLAYPKFKLTESEIDYLLSYETLPYFDVVTPDAGGRFVPSDPSDDMFIRCALAAKATMIISGDEHLLSLTPSPVPVLSVTQFLEKLGIRP